MIEIVKYSEKHASNLKIAVRGEHKYDLKWVWRWLKGNVYNVYQKILQDVSTKNLWPLLVENCKWANCSPIILLSNRAQLCSGWITLSKLDKFPIQFVCWMLMLSDHWIVVYPLDSPIQWTLCTNCCQIEMSEQVSKWGNILDNVIHWKVIYALDNR